MIRECIILAGGLGTRLRDTVPGIPKCMAPVAGRPFLFYVINYLRSQGIEKFIFSLGYKQEQIQNWLDEQFPTLSYQCSLETEPLGTGGAIQLACGMATEKNIAVANGDTLFRANLHEAGLFHIRNNAECTLLLKPMIHFDRYGVVETGKDNLVTRFREKQYYPAGHINGGLYLLQAGRFLDEELPGKFSFERDYLEKFYSERRIYGLVDDGYFIDIGIPGDYRRAQAELSVPPPDLSKIDKSWTLFIDRDGVINHEKEGDYIRNRDEFVFYEGVKEAMAGLARRFGNIIIISNQRGVGRGLMSEDELRDIHVYMQEELEAAGGRIDGIFYCTSTDPKHPDRKPNPGMAYHAKMTHPSIDFSRSVMIGNKPSDMLFARNAGMYSVFLATTHPGTEFPHPDIDLRFDSLPDFVNHL